MISVVPSEPNKHPSSHSGKSTFCLSLPKIHLFLFVFLFFCFSACANKNTENTPCQLEKKNVIPEYYPSSGVMISEALFDERLNKIEFIANMLSKGKVYVYCYPGFNINNMNKLYCFIDDNHDRKKREILKQNIVLFESKNIENSRSGWETTIWSRDWGPIVFSYGTSLKYADFKYFIGRKYEDNAVVSFANRQDSIDIISSSIYSEGGNFMSDSAGNCYVTDKIISRNKNIHFDPVIVSDEIIKEFHETLGCESVKFIESMPFETTGHIDLWAKLISNKIMLVAKLYDWQEELFLMQKNDNSSTPISTDGLNKIKNFLDKRVDEFEKLGFTVYRIPMPIPYLVKTKTGGNRYIFRTYANSLLYNTENTLTLYVPRYTNPYKDGSVINADQYIDQQYLDTYEVILSDVVNEIKNKFGLKITIVWVLSDDLITEGGAVHCVVMQLPISL